MEYNLHPNNIYNRYFNDFCKKRELVDWSDIYDNFERLENIVKNSFQNAFGNIFLKLIGSTATRTSIKGKEDLDCFVTFSERKPDNNLFLDFLYKSELNIIEYSEHRKYNYLRVIGDINSIKFVLVPIVNPNNIISTYEQEIFYHPEFVEKNKKFGHKPNVILTKEFFSQIGCYKEIKGISCELLIMHFGSFNNMLEYFVNSDKIRVNFSSEDFIYPDDKLIVDYPILGKRSLTTRINDDIFKKIKENSQMILNNPYLLVSDNLK